MTLKTLSVEVTTVLKPTATILSDETVNLLAAKRRMEEQNARLSQQPQVKSWILLCLFGILTFLLGLFYGEIAEKRRAADLFGNIAVELKQVCNGLGSARVQ